MFDLTAKVAIVTGSSKGIGRAIAEALARAGAKVVISSRKAEACEEVAAPLRKEGREVEVIPCHIGKRADCEALVAKTRERFGTVDVLVCNAAVNPYYGPLNGLTDEAFDKVMQTNVRSNLWLANLVRPEMAARRDGAIIIVSSIGGLKGTDKLGIYAISKAADFQLARNLAIEWGPRQYSRELHRAGAGAHGFRARAVGESESCSNTRRQRTPLRRIGEPDDIAGAAVFLASRAGSWMTGQTIVIDGGVTIA